MSDAKHTPGPWIYGPDPEGDEKISIHTPDGFYICLVDHATKQDANARLIAAAPELLEALEMADAALSGANMDMKAVERKIRAAIAKAKGETQ